jgi:hypothetical protein
MIARQLYHCRDLGEPFDFLAWFEYAPQNAMFFGDLVKVLRATEEWVTSSARWTYGWCRKSGALVLDHCHFSCGLVGA